MEGNSFEAIPISEPTEDVVRETPTGQSRLAYQLAATFLLIDAIVRVPGQMIAATSTDLGLSAMGLLVSFALAISLLEFRPRARILTIVLAFVAFLGSVLFLTVLELLAGWTGPVALLLLLTGQSKRWRLIVAVALYVVGLLIAIWSLFAVWGIGQHANVLVFSFLAAAILMSGAILMRYLAQESQFRRWVVILLSLFALVAWIAGYYASKTSLSSATFGVLSGAAVAAYLSLPDDKRRDSVVITMIALMALLVLLTICQWFFQNIGFGGW